MVDGQKVPIRRTRLRTADHREQRLGSYERFQRNGRMQLGVWDNMMRGLGLAPPQHAETPSANSVRDIDGFGRQFLNGCPPQEFGPPQCAYRKFR